MKASTPTGEARLPDLCRFYDLLRELDMKSGGARRLARCSGRDDWPRRGTYFFFEPGEERTESGTGPRVVRVGTHALKSGSRTTLWGRLAQHKGQQRSGGGNHRGSIFRLIVGTALMARDGIVCPTWGQGSSAPRDVRQGELHLERTVSRYIGAMPFLWLEIDDEPGADSQRGDIERNAIALLSNYGCDEHDRIDAPSPAWLGSHCDRERVRCSGLWNSNHIDECHDRLFLERMARLVERAGGPR